MLRSLHYYACYYFLLCLLHQQQQAASLTIIIDGATTNEWATRDEYQRLVEASANGQQQQQQQLQQQQQRALELASGNRQPDDEDEQQLEADNRGASISAAEELESSLDRLDLIEAQQMKLKQLERQQQLQQQQRHSPNIINQHYHPQTQERLRSFAGGARTLNDLVPIGDEMDQADDTTDPRQRLVERESTPQKYCGSKLMDVLELVCQGRFYGGDYEPQIMNPTIKSKRFIESLTAGNGNQVDHSNVRQAASLMGDNDAGNQRAALPENQQLEPVSRRRKLRTLANEYDGDNIRLTEANKNKNNNNNNNNNMDSNHYLSYSKNNDQNVKQQQQQLTNPINNNDNYQQQTTNLNSINRRNKHSKMYLYRRIRGASAECCERACYIEELRPYCKT